MTTHKAISFVFVCALILAIHTTVHGVHAATIFSEDFNGYASNPNFPGSSNDLGGHRTIYGVPTVFAGADSPLWMGARFEQEDSDPISSDIGVLRYGNGGPGGAYGNPAGRVSDDAGLVAKIDLTGFTDIELAFDWRTFATETSDRLVAAYYILGADIGSPNGTYDWFSNPALGNNDLSGSDPQGPANPWYQANWTEVHRGTNPNSFQQESGINLTGAGGNVIYLAFWMDNGDHDLGKIDNIVVSGTVVPEPSAMLLAVMGLVAAFGGARRRSR